MSLDKKNAVFEFLRGKRLLLLLLAAGLLLLLFAGGGKSEGQGGEEGNTLSPDAYRAALEEELTLLCSRVEGVGRLELMVRLEGSGYAHYATDTWADGRKEYVTVGGGCVLLYEEYPRVVGVAVVCDGGDDARVTEELTSLLCALLDIRSNRVYIAPYAKKA